MALAGGSTLAASALTVLLLLVPCSECALVRFRVSPAPQPGAQTQALGDGLAQALELPAAAVVVSQAGDDDSASVVVTLPPGEPPGDVAAALAANDGSLLAAPLVASDVSVVSDAALATAATAVVFVADVRDEGAAGCGADASPACVRGALRDEVAALAGAGAEVKVAAPSALSGGLSVNITFSDGALPGRFLDAAVESLPDSGFDVRDGMMMVMILEDVSVPEGLQPPAPTPTPTPPPKSEEGEEAFDTAKLEALLDFLPPATQEQLMPPPRQQSEAAPAVSQGPRATVPPPVPQVDPVPVAAQKPAPQAGTAGQLPQPQPVQQPLPPQQPQQQPQQQPPQQPQQQPVPVPLDLSQCDRAEITSNVQSIVLALAPCLASATEACCEAVMDFAGPSGEYANCLCVPQIFDDFDGLDLKSLIGVDVSVAGRLQECAAKGYGISWAGRPDGICPAPSTVGTNSIVRGTPSQQTPRPLANPPYTSSPQQAYTSYAQPYTTAPYQQATATPYAQYQSPYQGAPYGAYGSGYTYSPYAGVQQQQQQQTFSSYGYFG